MLFAINPLGPVQLKVRVPVPPVEVPVRFNAEPSQIGLFEVAEAVSAAEPVMLIVPVTGPQLLASVMLYGRLTPGNTPVKIPVALVWPLKVYE